MDTDALHSTLLSMTVISEKLRLARESLSSSEDNGSPLGRILLEAEGDLRVAKATLGGELGFNLCPHCWPPELITIDQHGRTICPRCGPLSYEQAA